MSQIVDFVFNEWWFICPLTTSVPSQDLDFIKNVKSFAVVDDEDVNAATCKAFSQHTWFWFMSGDLIP